MSADYQQYQPQILRISENIAAKNQRTRKDAQTAIHLLHQVAKELHLRRQVLALRVQKEDYRGAIPAKENIADTFSFSDRASAPVNLFAADGSQILPDRHDELPFGLINVAVFALKTNCATTPQITQKTELLDFASADLESDTNARQTALKRDVLEREFLAEKITAADFSLPIVALTDGPLEIFSQSKALRPLPQWIERYKQTLSQFADLNAILAGYIDRPQADYVVRMLTLITAQELKLCDIDLFQALLSPGKRSAVFELNSLSNQQTAEEILKTFFFYLHVGTTQKPSIARIEIPGWVAQDKIMIAILHAVLLQQCRSLDPHPYPYALHRAHECAVIRFAEKEYIKNLILRQMLTIGEQIQEKTNKQIAKDNFGRK